MIYGQNTVLKTLYNAQAAGRLHHSLFFYGPDTCGKFETALDVAKAVFCKEKTYGFCGRCVSCKNITLYRHPDVTVVANDDRLLNLKFFLKILDEKKSLKPAVAAKMTASLMAGLLYRYKTGFLNHLARDKATYTEGVVLSKKQTEEILTLGYKLYNEFIQNKGTLTAAVKTYVDVFTKIQNSLDRMILTSSMLDKLLLTIRQKAQGKKVIIIQNIDRLSGAVAAKFLKTLEEPPEDYHIIMTADHISRLNYKVTAPLRSRCFELEFKKLNTQIVNKILQEKFFLKQISNVEKNHIRDFFSGFISQSGKGDEVKEMVYSVFEGRSEVFFEILKKFDRKEIHFHDIINEIESVLYERKNLIGYRDVVKINRTIYKINQMVSAFNFSEKNGLIFVFLEIEKCLKHRVKGAFNEIKEL